MTTVGCAADLPFLEVVSEVSTDMDKAQEFLDSGVLLVTLIYVIFVFNRTYADSWH